jgi:hypothetical protein
MRKQIGYMLNQRIKNETARQRRERVLMAGVLFRFGYRYWESVWIMNPNYTNRHGVLIGGSQWIDYIVVGPNRKLFAIEFYPKWGKHNPHKYQLEWLRLKKEFLSARGIDTIVLRRNESSQHYYTRIYMWLHATQGGRGRRTD